MPELAEVEYFRKRWDPGLGKTIEAVLVHRAARVFNNCDVDLLQTKLTGAVLKFSEASGKQMLFHASGNGWLGVHLGMTGKLAIQPANYEPGKPDHLVLVQASQMLVFSDFRMFGRIHFQVSKETPAWWSKIAPPILSPTFTPKAVAEFLKRRTRPPIKAVLLMQERFPGVGNWMADEILWRSAIHPRRPAGSLDQQEIRSLHRETRWVCRHALQIISDTMADPPKRWLFPHRWESGGHCPRTGAVLVREEIGGRMTCWSPGRQKVK